MNDDYTEKLHTIGLEGIKRQVLEEMSRQLVVTTTNENLAILTKSQSRRTAELVQSQNENWKVHEENHRLRDEVCKLKDEIKVLKTDLEEAREFPWNRNVLTVPTQMWQRQKDIINGLAVAVVIMLFTLFSYLVKL